MNLVLFFGSFFLINVVSEHIDRICGGKPAEMGQFPFFAQFHSAINSNGLGVDCGGSLVTRQWVLTAAHCFPYPREEINHYAAKGMIMVIMGSNKAFELSAKWNYAVEIILHPKYTREFINEGKGQVKKIRNDIALAWLLYPYILTKNIQTIGLPNYMSTKCGLGIIVGIGKTSFADNQNKNVNFAMVHPKDREQLVSAITPELLGHKVFFTEVEWCKGHALQGDSGGPFFCRDEDGLSTIYGICSAGFNSTIRNTTSVGVYESVYHHMDFITTYTFQTRYLRSFGLPSRHTFINLWILGLQCAVHCLLVK